MNVLFMNMSKIIPLYVRIKYQSISISNAYIYACWYYNNNLHRKKLSSFVINVIIKVHAT